MLQKHWIFSVAGTVWLGGCELLQCKKGTWPEVQPPAQVSLLLIEGDGIKQLFLYEERLLYIICHSIFLCGPGSVVAIATGYGLDGPGIESRWGRDFPHLSRPALGPTQSPVQWVPGLSRGKKRPGCDADPSPPSSPQSWKGRAIPLLSLQAVRPVQSLSACTRVTFTFLPYSCRTGAMLKFTASRTYQPPNTKYEKYL